MTKRIQKIDRLIPFRELPKLAQWSMVVYQHWILSQYPDEFIQEFSEMDIVFGNECADAYRRGWLFGIIWVWTLTLLTLPSSIQAEDESYIGTILQKTGPYFLALIILISAISYLYNNWHLFAIVETYTPSKNDESWVFEPRDRDSSLAELYQSGFLVSTNKHSDDGLNPRSDAYYPKISDNNLALSNNKLNFSGLAYCSEISDNNLILSIDEYTGMEVYPKSCTVESCVFCGPQGQI